MLIVEDGTGLADAEVFISVADADDYHAKRDNAAWAALTTPRKEALLRKASDYLLQTYSLRWAGYRTSDLQALDWPRTYVPRRPATVYTTEIPYTDDFYYAANEIPREVKYANAELALRAVDEDLSIEFERLTTEESVGSLTVKYDKSARDKRTFPFIDNLLKPFLKAGGGGAIVRN